MVKGAVKYKDIEQQALKAHQSELGGLSSKKIVFVLPALMAGGAERVLITLMNGLDRSRFSPEFVVLNDKGPLRDWISDDIPVHSFGSTRISGGLWKLLSKLNEIQPDVIVSTMTAMNYGLLLIKPFLKKRPRLIVRETVVPSSIAESQKMPWVVRSAYQTLYPRADLVLSPAQCIIDEFDTYLGMNSKRHLLLHNPVDLHKIRSEQIIQAEPDEERLNTVRFICAGRLHAQKGFDRLIEALPALHEKRWTLHIMGTGDEEGSLRALIKDKGLEDRVFLDGLVKRPWPRIGAADCLLLPSRWEGLPNVVLEALAVGTPVIGMREAGGIDEIAAIADPGAVTIADTIADMVMLMRAVHPKPTTVFRPSLLPEYFYLDRVVSRFSDLLDGHNTLLHTPLKLRRPIRENSSRKNFGRRPASRAA